jgi:hypothetical protein
MICPVPYHNIYPAVIVPLNECDMMPTQVLQEIKKRIVGRLTQAAAAQLLGMYERSFRRYLSRRKAEVLATVDCASDPTC